MDKIRNSPTYLYQLVTKDRLSMNDHPNFTRLLDLIYQKAPLQKKKLEEYLLNQTSSFFKEAEEFASQYTGYLNSQDIAVEYAVDAYLKMCNDMMRCQISFMRSGKYPVQVSTETFDNVYNNPEEMKSYMIGLAMSQFLWGSHYEIFSCLKLALQTYAKDIKSYLEIGPGHGLFLGQAVTTLEECNEYVVVDISPTSIEITKSIMDELYDSNQATQMLDITYYNEDMLSLSLGQKYDFITMGEVIEHVSFPEKLLTQFCNLLTDNGKGFVSTCVNCPAIDHIYHFHSVDEIREMFSLCGFDILEERVCPVESLPMEEIVKRKITINYCAIVCKRKNNE
jgi:2-polyprenyl-3-methyl-5-hydroxy-6-metoxy-1,4-benzoquinol methylase